MSLVGRHGVIISKSHWNQLLKMHWLKAGVMLISKKPLLSLFIKLTAWLQVDVQQVLSKRNPCQKRTCVFDCCCSGPWRLNYASFQLTKMRAAYIAQGPNYIWHINSYDKLKTRLYLHQRLQWWRLPKKYLVKSIIHKQRHIRHRELLCTSCGGVWWHHLVASSFIISRAQNSVATHFFFSIRVTRGTPYKKKYL